MNINTRRVKACLQSFDFKKLFIQELNWAVCDNSPLLLETEDYSVIFTSLAQQGGMLIYQAECTKTGDIPPYSIRRSIEAKIAKIAHEHIIIFVDKNRTQALWQWVKREQGKSAAAREHRYFKGQTGEPLLQKLKGIAFGIDDLDEEGKVAIAKVASKVASSFDVEKITKRFFDAFKNERDSFAQFIAGIKNAKDNDWYVSVMLNRLMFIYFIQKKGFLNKNPDYLTHKLDESQQKGQDLFYSRFLIPLFFEGFAKEKAGRPGAINQLLGDIPYLNGGIFQKHQLEEENPNIVIPDAAFVRIFSFFGQWDWHLEYRPVMANNEINPDVLGYIFEQYINRKQMGAYYTKEDITGYNCRNTIIPALFDKLNELPLIQPQLFPIKDIEPYIYPAVKQEEYLPIETDREYSARQERYHQIKLDFAAGKISNINDLITYNLDILRFAYDWARNIQDARVLRAFYFECLNKIAALDPTVGSGAFLFAALNILEPLYEICLDKMPQINCKDFPQIGQEFASELKRVSQHPNRKYFILKNIIINNLYGVDIMEEAVEICKLRLFLKLVAQVDDSSKIEPLPDIDFNIRAGNSLVGYANLEEIRGPGHLDLGGALQGIEKRIEAADRSMKHFRILQTAFGISASDMSNAKLDLKKKLADIQGELDQNLFAYYGAHDFTKFKKTHQPFHWFVEFYSIMNNGGFDVIIGNPPYVEYKDVRSQYTVLKYSTESCNNLFAYILERCTLLGHKSSRIGMIVPLSAFSTDRMTPLISHIKKKSSSLHISNFSWRPGKLFDGVNLPLSILLQVLGNSKPLIYSTKYLLWESETREWLFSKIEYSVVIDERLAGSIPKMGSPKAVIIMEKLRSHKSEINNCFLNKQQVNSKKVYYRRGGLYWKVFVNFITDSSEEKIINIRNEINPDAIIAALSSTLWFWYFTSTSDCRHLGNRDINTFPFNPTTMSPLMYSKLCDLGNKYVQSLKLNAENEIRVYKGTKSVKCISFKVKESKSIIDEIDRILAEHYGFTEEELDFIINYDIKYRMGKDDGEAEEEE